MSPKVTSLARIDSPAPSTALAAITPQNFGEVERLASMVAKVGICGVKSPEEAAIRLLTGMELGLSPMQALRGINVINGRPALGAELMVALCQRSPQCEYFDPVETSATSATWVTRRVGRKEVSLTWTLEMAQRAGLANGNVWTAYPDTMLRWRCASALAKMVYPECMMGLLSNEEAQGIDPSRAPQITTDGEVIEVAAVESGPRIAVSAEALAALMGRVDGAETVGALNDVAKDAAKALKAGLISADDMAHVKDAVLAKRTVFATLKIEGA